MLAVFGFGCAQRLSDTLQKPLDVALYSRNALFGDFVVARNVLNGTSIQTLVTA